MNEIKPIYRTKVFDESDWGYHERLPSFREEFSAFETFYPASAYEALQKENEELEAALTSKQGYAQELVNNVIERAALTVDDENDCTESNYLSYARCAQRIRDLKQEHIENNQFKAIEQAQDNEGWIPWVSKDNPCKDDLRVDIFYSDGEIIYGSFSSAVRWGFIFGFGVIAYRIAK